MHAARQRPAEQVSPCAHMVPLQLWQVVGAEEPGMHTLEEPVESPAQVLVVPHEMLGHALQNPPWPCPAQHARQNKSELDWLSCVHTLHPLQILETVHGSPVSPRGVHVPPVHKYPVAHSVAEAHWLVHVIAFGTQKPSGIWQV